MSASIPDFEHARLTCDDRGVYTLTIVEAGALNILGTPVLRGLTDALQWLAGRTDPRVLILRGSGERAFVAGADIHEMAALAPESARAFITRVRALCDAVRALPVRAAQTVRALPATPISRRSVSSPPSASVAPPTPTPPD